MLFGRRKPGYTTTVDGSVDPEQAVLELQKAELAAKKKPKAEDSEEGNADCLGIFDVDVKRFIPQRHEDKVPHMGWNTITDLKGGLFSPALENQFVYFVHSYYVPLNADTAATTEYILPFSASLHKDNFYATQFHPEKSGSVGEQILKNFLNL